MPKGDWVDSCWEGAWCFSRMRCICPEQGWKLHVSATIKSAADVLARVKPILNNAGVLFKSPRDLRQLLIYNSGAGGFSQIGKFVTVYPRSRAEAVFLARALHRATRGLPGPRIPFDVRYRANSNVYYRFGSFRATATKPSGFVRAPDGKLYPDLRGPKKAVPAWVQDPFVRSRAKPRKSRGPIGLDYLVYNALAQRGKGGVYIAIDLSVSPPRKVILKEGRRHGETDRDGSDGYARIRHEGRVLRTLRKAGVAVPEVFREFSQNGNRYLVLEPIAGRPLLPAENLQPARPSCRRAGKILDRIGPLLSAIHAAGWVWRDCKPSHLFLDGDTTRLIDMEIACRISDCRVSPWGSPDYLPPGQREKLRRTLGTLEDDYALGVIAFQLMCGQFPPQSVRKRAPFYREVSCPDSLRARIETLLRY